MFGRITYLYLLIALFLISNRSFSQKVDTTSFTINTRLSFYSFEKSGEMILHLPPSLSGASLNITLKVGNSETGSWKRIHGDKLIRLPFSFDLPPSLYNVTVEISSAGGIRYKAKSTLTILAPRQNEVKTDRLTGGLIVDRRIFFPFGFYCYSPVYPTLPEEEAVMGFNMMSPYQKILPETFNERKAYMDRCAQLGMKVHYNLLSVSGGGGVSSKIEGLNDEQKLERLLAEIKAFRDHPALLAWYISDEPTGNKIAPEKLENIYKIVREADPWHPVSIVFMAPFLSSKRYSDALDIVMADPYPVPNRPVTQVGNITGQLRSEFNGKKPVWIVPQAFGGGENWGREPSIQELRTMTYQAIINGARGIQYFVRQGPNSFPKSTAAWSECGKMALEIAEITPWLLSDEEPLPVRTDSKNIQVSSAMHDGQLLILVVNNSSSPQKADIRIASFSATGSVRVLFENRSVLMSSGLISDFIPSYGSQVYLVNIKAQKETIQPYRGNLVMDPGFEDNSSPGVPASCYAWNEGDRGATFFIDSREHFEGNHSLRLITPQDNKGSRLRFFPVNITIGRTYMISVRARTDQTIYNVDKNISGNIPSTEKEKKPCFELALGDFGKAKFYPGPEWQQFLAAVKIPSDNSLPPKANVILRLPCSGTVWFDMLQVFEATDINRSINPGIIENYNILSR